MIGSPADICSTSQPVGKSGRAVIHPAVFRESLSAASNAGGINPALRSGPAATLRRDAIISAFLFFATLLLFLRVIQNRFINFDDPDYITLNQHVQQGLSSGTLRWAFTSFWASNWHPLTWLSRALDCQLYGLNAVGHHLTNALLHSCNAVLLFVVLRTSTQRVWASALAAALFAWHPLRVESVAWVAERKDVLSGFFFFLCLLTYVQYARRPHFARYLLVVVFLILGLLAKPMLVTVPFILLLLDFWPLRRFATAPDGPRLFSFASTGRLVLEKIPFLVLSAAACAVTFVAQRSGHAVQPTGRAGEWMMRLAYAVHSYSRYVLKTAYPIHLAVFYPFVWRSLAELLSGIAVLLAVTAAAALQWRQRPFLIVGWLWFLGMLVPVIGIVQVGAQSLADRYTYLPGIGLAVALSWSIAEWAARSARERRRAMIGAGALLTALAILTWRQIGYWHDTGAIFSHALAVGEDSPLARSGICASRWEEAERQHLIAAARSRNSGFTSLSVDTTPRYYQAIFGGAPVDAPVHYALAMQLKLEGDEGDALQQLMIAVKIDPTKADAQCALADGYFRLRRYADALSHYQRSAALQPGRTSAQHGIEACRAQLSAAPGNGP